MMTPDVACQMLRSWRKWPSGSWWPWEQSRSLSRLQQVQAQPQWIKAPLLTLRRPRSAGTYSHHAVHLSLGSRVVDTGFYALCRPGAIVLALQSHLLAPLCQKTLFWPLSKRNPE